ncbi:Glycogenin-1 [Hanseniaspora osmophila]|uniref:Glycogenin-1 n=1 Tax=Hanseniaspora osmophila TaxID=56408 RepID=A0A1E5RNN8_9ASCO|nr:Glycogenin-1 [Hanseniaspora osmophila]
MKRKVAIVNLLYLDESHESDSKIFMEYYNSCVTQAKQVQMGIVAEQLKYLSFSDNGLSQQTYNIEQILILNQSAYTFLKQCPLSLRKTTASHHNSTNVFPQSDLFEYVKALYKERVVVLPNSNIIKYKLHCWSLKHYDMVLYMDLDMYFKEFANVLDIFTQYGIDSAVQLKPDQIVASTESTWCDMFNTGLFLIVPTQKKHAELVQFAQNTESIDTKDQGLLNQYFNPYFQDSPAYATKLTATNKESSTWVRLSYCFNVMMTPRIHSNGVTSGYDAGQTFLYSIEEGWWNKNGSVNQNFNASRAQNKKLFERFVDKTKIVHFIVKPWSIGIEYLKPKDNQEYNPNDFYIQWHRVYEQNVPLEIKRYPVKAIKICALKEFVQKCDIDTHKKTETQTLKKNTARNTHTQIENQPDKIQSTAQDDSSSRASRLPGKNRLHESPSTATHCKDNSSAPPIVQPPVSRLEKAVNVVETNAKDTLFPWCQYKDYPKPTRTFD